ncbi:uncharacterized protein [Epargyreus clarus]|uniref:uncharacterized protein n=1 Tax=Epargyreus clarus TaxID=520877 RepID=UPI003C2E69EE
MQGSLSLGKDVVDSLSFYLDRNVRSGRRSLMPSPIEDPITLLVRSTLLCKDMEFCQDKLQHFVDEYIIVLAKVMSNILNGSQADFTTERYEKQLKYSLEYIKNILEDADGKVEKRKEAYYWIQSLKKINAKFQEMLEVFVPTAEKVADESKEKKELIHKIIIAATFIERKYEIKLCADFEICSKSHECTRALGKILTHFKTLPEDRIRLFIKYFHESLSESSFYNHVSDETAHEFQLILYDMAYTNGTPTKDLMLSVLKTVDVRQEIIDINKGVEVAHDILLAHMILSDMDHLFSERKDPFASFLNHFYDWLASNKKLSKHVGTVMLSISKEIWSHEEDLVLKLINEVRVFLEMTVGPEK